MKLFNKRTIVVLLVILIILASYGFLREALNTQKGEVEPSPSPTNKNQATYQSISPGSTTKDEIVEKLGEPKEEAKENEITRLEYLSSTLARDHEVIIENNKVVFIKEIITQNDNKTAEQIIDSYGNTDRKLFGPHSSAGFDLYVYPENGIAYVGNSEGILIEIWYFEQMNYEDFKRKWAEGYSETLTPQQ